MNGRIENIQALRAAAALAVVLAHISGLQVLDPSIPKMPTRAGVAGVDIFFVLSGFIIAWITRGDRWGPDLAFLSNRLWRVLPLYWLFTLPELPWASIIAYARDGFVFLNWDYYLKSVLLIPAFSPGSALLYPALNPGWTLLYEMVFYLIWFALMFGRRQWLLMRIVTALIALLLSGVLAPQESAWRAFATNPIFFEFALGVAIAELAARRDRPFLGAGQATALILASLLAIFGLDYALDSEPRLLIFGLPSAVILLAVLDLHRAGYKAPRWLCFIGDASYAVYLVQAGMIAAMTSLLATTGLPGPIKLLLIAASAIVTGLVMHVIFERPIMRWRAQSKKGGRVLSTHRTHSSVSRGAW
jgi:exopolysaccharide production protein ExoZ